MAFIKTAKQNEAQIMMRSHYMTLLEGGARSGKTLIALRQMFMRAAKTPSRHLVVRRHAVDARRSIVNDTMKKLKKMCFPKMKIHLNKTEMTYRLTTLNGGESEVIVAGLDDAERADKILGTEYSTIYVNECSQLKFDSLEILRTRLAEVSGLSRHIWLDQNPTVKSHWTWRLFREGLSPKKEQMNWDTAYLQINPVDNAENLDPDYLHELATASEYYRKRFYLGEYVEQIEGALWSDLMLNEAKLRPAPPLKRTVVAIDPSVSNREDSDECGIVVASEDVTGGGVVHGDFSGIMTTDEWAHRAVDLYRQYKANVIVAEVNNGGNLVADVIHNIDPNIYVEMVHAAKSKYARAEPVSQLYEKRQKRVTHEGEMTELEEELTTYVPRDAKHSPNRLDALVWALTYLIVGGDTDFEIAGF